MQPKTIHHSKIRSISLILSEWELSTRSNLGNSPCYLFRLSSLSLSQFNDPMKFGIQSWSPGSLVGLPPSPSSNQPSNFLLAFHYYPSPKDIVLWPWKSLYSFHLIWKPFRINKNFHSIFSPTISIYYW